MLQKPSINRPSYERVTIKSLQVVGIIAMIFCNEVRAFLQMIKLAMLALVFMPSIPLQNQVSLLEIIKLSLYVKNFLFLVHESLGFIHNLILDLLHFHKLVNPPLEWI